MMRFHGFSPKCRNSLGILAAVGLVSVFIGPQSRGAEAPATRKTWAKALQRPGLPNLHKVNDRLYRGAQPEKEGYAELAKMGVKTIICLRSDDEDSKHLKDLPIKCVHIPFNALKPKKSQAVEFLKVVTDKKRQPVFVHCQHGSDRTGMMCALYRVAVDGWSKQAAVQEMTKGGFGFHWWCKNLTKFAEKTDVDSLKKKAGLKEKAESKEKGSGTIEKKP
ncbi:MAG: tyrosine-protein phosphatase [Pirellulales bacterium]|nr:tyrosine-protein phosphatase [Pirellulales bacterium]